MKTMFLVLIAAITTTLAVVIPTPAQQPDPEDKDAEPLPPAPKVDPKSVHVENPELKGLIIEVLPDKKTRRVLLATEVCLREGPLEIFMCKKGTKEHEAILRTDIDALKIHEGLIFAGAAPGKPTQFVNPKTEEAEYKPATGTKINVSVHYTKGGKTLTHPAQEWIWDAKKKAQMPHGWVFAGSIVIVDPCNGKKFYAANSGDVISISNFPYSMLEIPAEVSKDDANLVYDARTERIPPLRSKVWVILEPVIEKK
ncbi:MAG TPA: YdjY domain-containing protein [Gemmata sp.]|jgi:hypothetical protein|nr:YdjY domain-containing protein [Gemmata sp.]